MPAAAFAMDAASPIGGGTLLDRHGALGEDIAPGEIKFLIRKPSNHYMLLRSAQTGSQLETFFDDKDPQALMQGPVKIGARPSKTHSLKAFFAGISHGAAYGLSHRPLKRGDLKP